MGAVITSTRVAIISVFLALPALFAGVAADDGESVGLSDENLARVVDFVVNQILETGDLAISGEEIERELGIELVDADSGLLQAEVLLALEERGAVPDLGESRCEQYGACSIYGNLSFATGDVLELYEREIAEDGRTYENLGLAAFEARNLENEVVRTTDLLGEPAVLVFLAVHCQHSLDTIPILNRMVDSFGVHGLRVIGVYVNSGSVEDINVWLPEQGPRYEVWVHEDPALGDLVDNHLVPVYFYIDPQGRITEKTVGFKEAFDVRVVANRFLDKLQESAL